MNNIEIRAVIDGRVVSREEIRKCEAERCYVAARKLKVEAGDDIAVLRRNILARKLEVGKEGLSKLTARECRLASLLVDRFVRKSEGRYVLSGIDIYAKGISGGEFVTWFEKQAEKNNTAAMLQAHPEHYIIENHPDGSQEVCETNGGSPFAASFTIFFNDTASINIPLLPGHPYRIEGVSKANGRRIGAARHQFQDTEEGLHGHLCIEFPEKTMKKVVDGHKWHLAIEFANWIEASASGEYDKKE